MFEYFPRPSASNCTINTPSSHSLEPSNIGSKLGLTVQNILKTDIEQGCQYRARKKCLVSEIAV